MQTASELTRRDTKPPALRKRYGLSIHDVARATGIADSTYHHIETTGYASMKDALTLARFFDLSAEELFGGEG